MPSLGLGLIMVVDPVLEEGAEVGGGVEPDVDPPLELLELATLTQAWLEGLETPAELKART